MQELSVRLIVGLLLLLGLVTTPAFAQDPPLRIAMSGAFQPFSTVDAKGQLDGFDADIARALARGMGRRPELVQIDWNGIQAGLHSGKYDLICGSMAMTPERLQQMSFSLPYYVSGAQTFGAPGGRPKRLGVTESSTYASYINQHSQKFAGTRVVTFGSEAEILTALAADKVDGFVSDRIVGGFYLSRSAAKEVRPLGDLLYVEACGIAARPGDQRLILQVNSALFAMIGSGEYQRIYRNWVGEAPDLALLFHQWGVYNQTLSGGQENQSSEIASESDSAGTLGILLHGALLTLQLSLLAAVLSLGSGLALGLATVSTRRISRALAALYVGLVRGTPLLVQLFLSYFVIATSVNRWLGFEAMGAFSSALLALVVNATAYNAETLRGAILGVGQGQWDAAHSLGMTRARVLARIVLPQALRAAIPSLGNNLVVLVKDTSLVGAITLIELTYAARNVVFQTGQAFTPFLTAGGFYLVIITGLGLAVRSWEKRMATP